MKKALIIVLVLLIVAVSAAIYNMFCVEFNIGDSIFDIRDEYETTYLNYMLDVVRTDEGCVALVSDAHNVTDIVEFSNDRKPTRVVGLKLVDVDEINNLLGKFDKDIEAEFGEKHLEYTTSLGTPSYITKDGYLLVLKLGHAAESGTLEHPQKMVYRVMKIDLFTDEVMEDVHNYDYVGQNPWDK